MKSRLLFAATIIFSLGLTLNPVYGAFPTPASLTPTVTIDNPALDFTIVNKTGYGIKALSIGATGTGDWAPEDEVLHGRAFANGSALEVKFHPRATAAKWDILVVWADGSGGAEWEGLDLTTINKLTLVYDADSDTTSAEVE
ncbi:MAG: hypothetical protein HY774_07160 [Acidobacteria bacterium]|nr:hypothetical protein [Acidobacteriota bacterium]